MVTKPDLATATAFMWRTARLLDRMRFACLFLDGERQSVAEALRPYQNSDGGFGNALEPDIRAPVSQPVPTWTALCILDEAGAFHDPMVAQACDYLLSITTAEGGVPYALPSVRDYPRAPWWEAEGETPPASLNPTAAIAALLHKHHVEHPWLAVATDYCWRKLDAMDKTEAYEMRSVLPFLDFVSDRQRAEHVFERIGHKILEQKLVALVPAAEDDSHSPLKFAPNPSSLARRLFSDTVIEAHIDALASDQQEDGGWNINWLTWNPDGVFEWRGILTIEALVTLRAYGRHL
ncbi:MAG TPA: hypothetical protein VFS83_06115 [Ktedonobacterales bacterium]|nr:hypothetical protein [Ktedonobacterales bacterium]